MEEIKKRINNAFTLIARMSVTGDNQDLCVAAKTELRIAYKRLEELNETSENKSDE